MYPRRSRRNTRKRKSRSKNSLPRGASSPRGRSQTSRLRSKAVSRRFRSSSEKQEAAQSETPTEIPETHFVYVFIGPEPPSENVFDSARSLLSRKPEAPVHFYSNLPTESFKAKPETLLFKNIKEILNEDEIATFDDMVARKCYIIAKDYTSFLLLNHYSQKLLVPAFFMDNNCMVPPPQTSSSTSSSPRDVFDFKSDLVRVPVRHARGNKNKLERKGEHISPFASLSVMGDMCISTTLSQPEEIRMEVCDVWIMYCPARSPVFERVAAITQKLWTAHGSSIDRTQDEKHYQRFVLTCGVFALTCVLKETPWKAEEDSQKRWHWTVPYENTFPYRDGLPIDLDVFKSFTGTWKK